MITKNSNKLVCIANTDTKAILRIPMSLASRLVNSSPREYKFIRKGKLKSFLKDEKRINKTYNLLEKLKIKDIYLYKNDFIHRPSGNIGIRMESLGLDLDCRTVRIIKFKT